MPNHFFSQNGLTACCTDTSITLFWDKPAAAPRGAEYTVSLNGEAIGRTDKTHFTIEGLSCWTMPLLLIPKRPTVHWRICVRKRPIRCSFSGGAAALGN